MNTAPSQYGLVAAIQADYEARAERHRLTRVENRWRRKRPRGNGPRLVERLGWRGVVVRNEGQVT